MFDNVNIDWHLTHDEGSTDFSDDETLDDHPRLNGSRTPDNLLHSPESKDFHLYRNNTRPLSVFNSGTTPNRGHRANHTPNRSSEWILDRTPTSAGVNHNDSAWARSTSDSGDSPNSYRNTSGRNMPPPPPPQGKKPTLCKYTRLEVCFFPVICLLSLVPSAYVLVFSPSPYSLQLEPRLAHGG